MEDRIYISNNSVTYKNITISYDKKLHLWVLVVHFCIYRVKNLCQILAIPGINKEIQKDIGVLYDYIISSESPSLRGL